MSCIGLALDRLSQQLLRAAAGVDSRRYAPMDTDLFSNRRPERRYQTSGECEASLRPVTSKETAGRRHCRYPRVPRESAEPRPLMNNACVRGGTFLISSRSQASLTPRPSGLKKQWLGTCPCGPGYLFHCCDNGFLSLKPAIQHQL
ncbi:hypothetical protein SKAU_G00385260 [Synaphobranchus kaupii]|uniref:Uncharacterized protein n=1 Tax=Synaphobranchus kaupii TaxID=118154 RepID=A0A9Q1IF64_SYNKA|nr:hypothetical protein SKAU_G00385260 [Synaphobranchus kaupii]